MIRRIINIDDEKCNGCGAITFEERDAPAYDEAAVLASKKSISQLAQWPCQIKLVPVSAPYFKGAELLIAADCTAYAPWKFSQRLYEGQDYTDWMSQVGCCGGLEAAVNKALQDSGKSIPLQVAILSVNGGIN